MLVRDLEKGNVSIQYFLSFLRWPIGYRISNFPSVFFPVEKKRKAKAIVHENEQDLRVYALHHYCVSLFESLSPQTNYNRSTPIINPLFSNQFG